jgi:hypothetical protein
MEQRLISLIELPGFRQYANIKEWFLNEENIIRNYMKSHNSISNLIYFDFVWYFNPF